ncbi:LLM class flavin-dependent oxidoreductase [Actinacidiphila glaucinigra]|uniref:LLM class flavin-dependent oxidoreductase n=1 Tax=Actinacidiphila glaucinigra TaxID=235986 RepID=UPI000B7792CB|nr:LLM class flavin-dependent oxidoreductase [Actinacidiphila glaucinigra]
MTSGVLVTSPNPGDQPTSPTHSKSGGAGDSADVVARGSSPVPLSVLDLTVMGEHGSPAEALQHTAALAQDAERWGYQRFWVAEHHSFPASASPAPAVLLSHLAHVTSTIRLGSGGVMLTNHRPLVVAEQFGVLDAFHPGRIDLGVGRNPGGLPEVMQALGREADDTRTPAFDAQVDELRRFLQNDFPDGHPYSGDRVHVVPAAPNLPLWVLGSGTTGAEAAARLGLPFAAAYHINPLQALKAVDLYRAAFCPSEALASPRIMVSVNVVCAPTEQDAVRIAKSGALMLMLARQGRQTELPSPSTAETYPYTSEDKEFVERWMDSVVCGTPSTVRARLQDLHGRTGADELMLSSLIHDFDARRRSYSLVADAFGMKHPNAES